MIAVAYLVTFVTAMVISLLLTWYVRNLAVRRNWAQAPESQRHIHEHPIPRLGGIALYVAVVATITLGVLFGYVVYGQSPDFAVRMLKQILPPATLILLLGLVDDFRRLSAWIKFSVQVLAAVILWSSGVQIQHIGLLGSAALDLPVSLVLTVLWVVGITNAFNLIDGLDGLAAGSALFSTVAMAIVFVMADVNSAGLISVALAGAILGFLRFNFNPATIFLGDSGSLLIGFLLSAIGVWGQKSPTLVAVAVPVVACGLPLLDTVVSIARRILSGKPVFRADRQHIHHKLLDLGLTQRQAVVTLYGVSALFAFLSLFVFNIEATRTGAVLAFLSIAAVIGLQQLRYPEFLELGRLARRTFDQKRVIVNHLALKQATNALDRCRSITEVVDVVREIAATADFAGYDLHLAADLLNEAGDAPLSWRSATDDESIWSMSIKLAADGVQLGELHLHRAAGDFRLMFDPHVLVMMLRDPMSEALQRIGKVARASHPVGSVGD